MILITITILVIHNNLIHLRCNLDLFISPFLVLRLHLKLIILYLGEVYFRLNGSFVTNANSFFNSDFDSNGELRLVKKGSISMEFIHKLNDWLDALGDFLLDSYTIIKYSYLNTPAK